MGAGTTLMGASFGISGSITGSSVISRPGEVVTTTQGGEGLASGEVGPPVLISLGLVYGVGISAWSSSTTGLKGVVIVADGIGVLTLPRAILTALARTDGFSRSKWDSRFAACLS